MKLTIQQLANDDRPREKLLEYGERSLSSSELIAILIGSGNAEKNAIELAQEIMQDNDNSIDKLARQSVSDLTEFKGIGEAKAVNIIAALELGRRRKKDELPQSKITCSSDAYNQFTPHLADLNHEEFWILCLSRSNAVLKAVQISRGGQAGTVVDPKVIYKTALSHKANSIIIAHNHPSNNLVPSDADKQITNKLIAAGKHLDLPVLDHIILGQSSYFSFADEGMI
jgi:DNA repair protein RadC